MAKNGQGPDKIGFHGADNAYLTLNMACLAFPENM
jgi:hypothetical protein